MARLSIIQEQQATVARGMFRCSNFFWVGGGGGDDKQNLGNCQMSHCETMIELDMFMPVSVTMMHY